MSTSTNHNLIKFTSCLSVFIGLIVLSVKVYGFNITHSQAMLASLFDSMFDVSSSLINLIIIRITLQPPDHNHRFGHEKFQDLAVFSQSVFFCFTAFLIFASAVKSLFTEHKITNPDVGINVMYCSLGLTFILVCYQHYVIRKTNSNLIAIDKLHYITDGLENIAVIVSIHLAGKFVWIDSICSLAIGSYILYSCYFFLKNCIKNLVDEEMSDADKAKILAVIKQCKQVHGAHDLKTRYAAHKPFIQFHLEMDANMPLQEAHSISEQITDQLLTIFPQAEIIIHQDPIGIDEKVGYRDVFNIQ